jgi:hypothetical protein
MVTASGIDPDFDSYSARNLNLTNNSKRSAKNTRDNWNIWDARTGGNTINGKELGMLLQGRAANKIRDTNEKMHQIGDKFFLNLDPELSIHRNQIKKRARVLN